MKKLIYDLSQPEIENLAKSWDEPPYRARQIWQGLYQSLWNTPGQFTHLPSRIRNLLSEEYSFEALQPGITRRSRDNKTIKTLFNLADGKAIESVLMKYDQRQTICISTQSGCAMGCVFCATGQMGFKRNLTSGEIIAQVLHYVRQLRESDEKLTNVVIMGMGEPFHNYDNTLEAIERLNAPGGVAIGARRFTISTVGLVPAIRKFTEENHQANLAISLHAADDDLRASMLPIARKYPLAELISACRDYVAETGRRITFEWALVDGVNDSVEQARKLSILVKGMLCHVNAIPLNPTGGFEGKAATLDSAEQFKQTLIRFGIPCTLRLRRGMDIQAGCGQLAVGLNQNDPIAQA